ncbi:MAG: hypothetical protein LH606_05220 [Cytophagaceae bacterium]|nr:hypothetical protein [Cytophagaceae bacterium]
MDSRLNAVAYRPKNYASASTPACATAWSFSTELQIIQNPTLLDTSDWLGQVKIWWGKVKP